jgi:RNA polymerase sigma-70 factor, ECF subfamily
VQDSDAVLVARVVAHDDRAAFELLVRRYQSPLRGFLRRLARFDAARADDLAQETFMKLFRSIGSYRGEAKFSSWLYSIAYHTFLNDQRGRIVETSFEESHQAPLPDTTQAAGDALDVEAALAHLNARQQAVFELHYRHGMTHQEVAGALELPLGTVKTDLSRGLDVLRRAMGHQEGR